MIKYIYAEDVKQKIEELISVLEFKHVNKEKLFCFRSFGTKSRAIARCYGLSKIWQAALQTQPSYIIEVISERFDSLPEEQKLKVLIHELLHVPKSFGGGFRNHSYVCKKNVDYFYELYRRRKSF